MKNIVALLAIGSFVVSAQIAVAQTAGASKSMASSVQNITLTIDPKFDVKEGSATYPIGVGSGLEYVGTQNGELVFYGITDRGPNLDGPGVGSLSSKIFPAPSFVPTIVEIRVKGDKARVTKAIPLVVAGKPITGLPLPANATGFSGEAALGFGLNDLGNDVNGLDPEAIRLDPSKKGFAWISDEYGPFIAQVELSTGAIVKKLSPGNGLPALFAKRQPNRGMEGLAVTASGKLLGVVQSILDVDGAVKKSKAGFVRLVSIDPGSGKTKQYAFPVDVSAYKKTADAKIGDLVALSETEFLIIEQGNDKDGKARFLVYKLSIKAASDIQDAKTADGKELETLAGLSELEGMGVVLTTKELILDLGTVGWTAEKVEGIAIIDAYRFAVISDNDFGVAAVVENPAQKADGKPVKDPTDYKLVTGVLNYDGKPTTAAIKLGKGEVKTGFLIYTSAKALY